MATLAVLPTDPLAFSDVIAFFGRDNPTAPQPFGGVGNYPPQGGVGFSGVDAKPTASLRHGRLSILQFKGIMKDWHGLIELLFKDPVRYL